jgi:hypothetical protein
MENEHNCDGHDAQRVNAKEAADVKRRIEPPALEPQSFQGHHQHKTRMDEK